jgi:hypothetical protein
MDTYENIFYLRLYQENNPQLIKNYIQDLCDKLNQKNVDFHLDLYLDTMFQDEAYQGGRGPSTTYPYVNFEKTLDDMGKYLSFDVDDAQFMKNVSDMIPTIKSPSGPISQEETLDEQPTTMSTCSDLLTRIPDDIQNEIVFELKLNTSTPQLFRNGGIAQLEHLMKNM